MRKSEPFSLPRTLGAWVLLLPGVIAFQPAFGGFRGYLAAFVGITLGAGIALLLGRLRWGVTAHFGALLGAYFLVGGPIVVPHTTIAGVIPSLETLRSLALLLFRSWNDLLTVATPAGVFEGPSAVPLIAGLISGAAIIRAVAFTRAVYSPLLIPLAWLALCIAFGVRNAPTAVWLGAALGVGMLAWLTAHRLAATRDANSQILLHAEEGLSRATTRVIAAGGVIALAAGAAVGVNMLGADRVNRHVLRDDVTPPLNIHEFASPLMKHRLYVLTQKDEVLFRVGGMPEDTRLRLAVLDTYDGNVFSVSQVSGEYLNVGGELPWTPEGAVSSVTVEAQMYDDVWLPTFGATSSIGFMGDRGDDQGRQLYANRESNQALTTARFAEGSGVSVAAVPVNELTDEERDAISSAGIGTAPLAAVSRVPDVLVQLATDLTEDATSAYGQLDAIATWLRSEGAYSDGSDGISRSGHTAERLGTMFAATQPVGDSEQYATAMALMATQLGIPVRVVMGFYPNADDEPAGDVWEVSGTQTQVWVEANLDGAGWVSFDPTPDRSKEPETDVPRPQPKPKPQVDPPPDPPEKLPEEPIIADEEAVNVDEEESDSDSALLRVLLLAAAVVGVAGVLALPLLMILALKIRRATRRRTRGEVTDQVAGAWDEVVDRARDLGYVAPTSKTRREAASNLQDAYPLAPVEEMATRVDSTIFSDVVPNESHRDEAWGEVKELKSALLASSPWYARPRAVFSTNSLKRRRTEEKSHAQRRTVATGKSTHNKAKES